MTSVDTVAEKKSEQVVQCDQCDYECCKDIALKQHINTKHKNTNDLNVPTQEKSTMYNCDEGDQLKKGLNKH